MELKFKFLPTTMVDAPGLAAVIFVKACNMRCNYCYNYKFFEDIEEDDDLTYEQVIEKIQGIHQTKTLKKKIKEFNTVDWLVVSGGEPFCMEYKDIMNIFIEAKRIGLKTMIYTNGTSPKDLKGLINNNLLDAVHIDYKSNHFSDITGDKNSNTYLYSLIVSSLGESWRAYKDGRILYFYVNTVWLKSIHTRCFEQMYKDLMDMFQTDWPKPNIPIIYNDELKPFFHLAWTITPVDLTHPIYGQIEMTEMQTKTEIQKYLEPFNLNNYGKTEQSDKENPTI
jgi:organic radical activating enzyme